MPPSSCLRLTSLETPHRHTRKASRKTPPRQWREDRTTPQEPHTRETTDRASPCVWNTNDPEHSAKSSPLCHREGGAICLQHRAQHHAHRSSQSCRPAAGTGNLARSLSGVLRYEDVAFFCTRVLVSSCQRDTDGIRLSPLTRGLYRVDLTFKSSRYGATNKEKERALP